MSTTDIAQYAFLPWARQGLSNQIPISHVDTLGIGSLPADEHIQLSAGVEYNGQSLSKTLQLIGPANITGINPGGIVCTEPKELVNNFEPNYLPFVEFYEVDFPWRYTPARPTSDNKLRPWIALIVLKEDSEEYEIKIGEDSRPFLRINPDKTAEVFHPHAQHWAWAHVHVHQALDDDSTEKALTDLNGQLAQDSDVAVSRLICPRKLEPHTKYIAMVIPAFEAGRLAGLGEDPSGIPIQQGSWDSTQTVRVDEYPIYFQWRFGTSSQGDFEALVQKLLPPIVPDPGLGERDMNISQSGYGLDGVADSSTVGLQGALRPPGFSPTVFPNGTGDTTYQSKLKDLLNLSTDQANGDTNISNNPFYQTPLQDDPIITPPLYGQWHALVSDLNDTQNPDWVEEVNLDPRNRAIAGLGVEVVRKNQESFMETAWAQIEEVNEVNQQIRQAELNERMNRAIHRKHLIKRDEHGLLAVSKSMQKKVLKSDGTSIEDKFRESVVPNAIRTATFRKLTRPGKKVIKRMNATGSQRVEAQAIKRYNEESVLKQAAKPDPAMSGSLSISALNSSILNLTKSGSPLNNASSSTNIQLLGSQFSQNLLAFQSEIDGEITETSADPISTSHWDEMVSELKTAIDPKASVPKVLGRRIQLWSEDTQSFEPIEELKPVMAYPEFHVPSYEFLKDLSAEYLIPNMHLIPNNCVTVLEPNQAFIEAYLAGANHEMARELLWREYPTDQRGSYFRQFWDKSDSVEDMPEEGMPDIELMSDWESTLGANPPALGPSVGLVLLIRGELLQKFPDTVIYAQRATYKDTDSAQSQDRILRSAEAPENFEFPLFKAQIDPDIALLGFSFDAATAKGDRNGGTEDAGWFFVIRERPGKLRFGLDIAEDVTPTESDKRSWNDFTWGHLVSDSDEFQNLKHLDIDESIATSLNAHFNNPSSLSWGTNAGDNAAILFQVPVAVAIHADKMID
ncbi:MAG: hypothetical protein AAF587_33720 [Bacteroidota bacterium]